MVKSYGWVVVVGGPGHYTVISWDWIPIPIPIPSPSQSLDKNTEIEHLSNQFCARS